MTQFYASLTPVGTSCDASDFYGICGTCAHRDCQGVCCERRSAWHGWEVDGAHRGCYFYNRLPRLGLGLADEPVGEQGD